MNNDHDTAALVTISKTRKEIVVAFRGTMNIWNIILDLATIAVTYPNAPGGIKLHVGFYIAAMSLYKDVSRSRNLLPMKFLNPFLKVVINVGFLWKKFPAYKIVIGNSIHHKISQM